MNNGISCYTASLEELKRDWEFKTNGSSEHDKKADGLGESVKIY